MQKFFHVDYKNFADQNRVDLAELLVSKAEHNLDKVFFVIFEKMTS